MEQEAIKYSREDLLTRYDVDFKGCIQNEVFKTRREVFTEVCKQFKEKYQEVYDNMEYFDIMEKYHGKDERPFPDFRWIAVFAVTGGSEGYYVHVETIIDEKRELIFLAKTLLDREHSFQIVRALSEILGV